jgi:hypothetical protein
VLNNAVQKAYRERVAAGLIKPQEEFERKPVVLIPIMPRETKRKGEVYPRLSWIVEATARYFDISTAELIGQSRAYRVCIPRQIAMYLCRDVTTRSTTEVGVALGGRDHTTIMHGVAAIKRRMAEYPELATKVGILRQIILNGMYVGGNDNGGAR